MHVIVDRAATGKNHGVILVPEGLIEFVPEMHDLLHELNELLANGELQFLPYRKKCSPQQVPWLIF